MVVGSHYHDILPIDLGSSKPPVSLLALPPILPFTKSADIFHRSSHENESPAIRRAVYQLQGQDTAYRKQLIITAFHEALQFADAARKSTNTRLFRKYFGPADKAAVDQVFANILGTDPTVGAPQLGDITVVFGDPRNICRSNPQGNMAYTNGPPPEILICDPLWRTVGTTTEHKTCNQLGNCASSQMTTISSVVLHEFM